MHDRMKMLGRLKEKRGEAKMSDEHKQAKGEMLRSLIGEMTGMMAEPLKGLKKVTVASDSPKGLEKGLDKAKEIIGQASDSTKEEGDATEQAEEVAHKDLDADEEEGESEEHKEKVLGAEASEEAEMSPEEIEEEIARLMKLKAEKSGM